MTFPDQLIVIGPPELDPADDHSIINLVAIVEVLSPLTEKNDCGAKFRNCQQIPSLMEFILVAQDEAVIERFVRQLVGADLVCRPGGHAGVHDSPVQIGLKDIYAGISFDTPAA